MNTRPQSNPERGSVLLVALILAGVIAISLVSYLRLANTSMQLADRTLLLGGSMNLAETGLEEAMWSINQQIAGNTDAWDNWSSSSGYYKRTFTGYALGRNATGEIKVAVKMSGSTPIIVTQSIITPINGTPIEKWILVQLAKSSLFANGLVAKDSVTFKGSNSTVDSWDSDPDNNSATSAVAYSTGVAKDSGTVGSASVEVSLYINNAKIWGYAATGGSLPSVGSNGVIGAFGSSNGTMDMSRVSTDFKANFDVPTTPAPTTINVTGSIGGNTTLPNATDSANADGKYYYRVNGISLTNKTLSINAGSISQSKADVVIIMSAGSDIEIKGGSGEIEIDTGSSLTIYTDGDIKISGNGVANGGTTTATAQQPINFQIWGTATTPLGQSIDVKGNGALSTMAYAPNADFFVNGNGDILGAVVAQKVTLVGNADFHYDESLADYNASDPFRISVWRELTSAADRTVFTSLMSF